MNVDGEFAARIQGLRQIEQPRLVRDVHLVEHQHLGLPDLVKLAEDRLRLIVKT